MSTHISDDLPRLLTGDASRAEVLTAASHLRTCVDCQQELVSAVVAHASLTSAQRFAAEVVALNTDAPVQADASEDDSALPDLSAVFAQARTEGTRADTSRASDRRGRRTRFAVAAAAAGVLIGGGGVAIVSSLNGSSSPSGTAVALQAFGPNTHDAKAQLGGGHLSIDASSLPAPDSAHRYEVWLTNSAGTAMQPVGWIGSDGKASLTVPQALANKFSTIQVSVQDLRRPSYDFSGLSVLRGSYHT